MLRFVKAEASRLVKAHTRGLVAVLDSMQRHGYVEPDAT
jgi:hypothetical protein